MTMTAEMWTCSKCGEAIEPQFDACWNCATFRDGVAEEMAKNPESQDEDVAPETKLDQILQLQRKQNEALDEIRSRVGCLYVYMIVAILLGLLAGLLSFAD